MSLFATQTTCQQSSNAPVIVGRSSCPTGGLLLRQLIRRIRPRCVTIVADNDELGINPTFHVRRKNPSGCWGFVSRSSLHSRLRRFGDIA